MTFFERVSRMLVPDPAGTCGWSHSLPLPDGGQIGGWHKDKLLQHKLWEALRIDPERLSGKAVLDVAASDGFFSVAASISGARHVTAVNHPDTPTWPANIDFANQIWNAHLEIITGDFREINFGCKYDIVLMLGIFYRIENVFGPLQSLKNVLSPGGSLYIETALTNVDAERPLFELATDLFPTNFPMCAEAFGRAGSCNLLAPNARAIQSLAHAFGFDYEHLEDNDYVVQYPHRGIFHLRRRAC